MPSRRSRRPTLALGPALVALAALGCGKGGSDTLDETRPITGPSDAGPPDAAAADADAAAADAAPDTCAPVPAAQPAPGSGALCLFDPAADDGAVFAALIDTRLVTFGRRGKARQVFAFDAAPFFPKDGLLYSAIVGAGPFVAAAAAFLPKGVQSPAMAGVELVVLREGAVVYHDSYLTPYENFGGAFTLRGNPNGTFAFGFEFGNNVQLDIIQGGARIARSAGFVPVANPEPFGVVAVEKVDPKLGAYPLLWFDPCTGAARGSAYSAQKLQGNSAVLGSSLVYADLSSPALVIESSSGATRREVGPPVKSVGLFDLNAAGWALLSTDDPARFVAVNAASGEERPVTVAFPPGFRRYLSELSSFGDAWVSNGGDLRVASDGRLLLAARSDSLGYIHASADGQSWTRLGLPVGENHGYYPFEQGGTVVALTASLGLLPSDWAPAPPGVLRLDSESSQAFRLDGSTPPFQLTQLGSGRFDLSPDGACLSTWSGSNLTALHVPSGQISSVDFSALLPAEPPPTLAWTWVPGQDLTPQRP